MRKLLIRSCLIAGLTWTYSCASNKETAPQAPAPGSSRSAGTNRPGGPSRHPGLPLRRNRKFFQRMRMKSPLRDQLSCRAISAPDCAPPGCRKPCCTIWTAS